MRERRKVEEEVKMTRRRVVRGDRSLGGWDCERAWAE